jgi:alpha-L-fucosidase
MTTANILTHLSNLEPRYCNFLLNCPPTSGGVIDQRIVDTITKAGKSWTANMSRPPLPAQPHAIEHPVTPVGAANGAGVSAWNAIDGYNDVFSPTSVGQTIWKGGAPTQSVTIDLGVKYYNLEILGYLPRQDYIGSVRNLHGNITGYTISVSDDNSAFQQVASGAWPADSTYKIAEWSPATGGRYVRLQATSASGSDSVVINEISIGGRTHTPTTMPVRTTPHAALQFLPSKHVPEKSVVIGGLCPVKSFAAPEYIFDMAGRTMKRSATDCTSPYIKMDKAKPGQSKQK